VENKDLLKKIAAIYAADPEKGKSFLEMFYKAKEEDFGEGFSVVDDPDQDFENDDAAKWLAEKEAEGKSGGKTHGFFTHADAANVKNMSLKDAKEHARELVSKQPGAREHNLKNANEMIQSASSVEELADGMSSFASRYKNVKGGGTSNYSGDWKPSSELSDEQTAAIKQHMEDGYSEREAHRFAGSHKEEVDFMKALKSRIKPSMMSDKMIDDMKGLAKEWLSNADRHEKLNADIEKNPMKHASGRMLAAHEENMGDYKKAYNDFLSSDEVKDLKGRERHKAISAWKKQYREENPDHTEKISNVSQAQGSFGESREASKQSLQDKLANIISGGGFSPDETHSTQAGAQHAGISLGGEGEKPTGSITKDPMSSFAAGHQKLVGMLSDEQKARFDRINSARASQGKQTIVRRKKDGEE
jgi:hypothetical protein